MVAKTKRVKPVKSAKSTDRHKPRKLVGVRGALALKVQRLAEKRKTSSTEEVNRAVEEMLRRENLLPPARV